MENEQADAGRGGRTRLKEAKLSGSNRDREILYSFPLFSADHEQEWQPYPVDLKIPLTADGLNVLGWVTNPTYCNVAILPVDTKDLPGSPPFSPHGFLSRCRFSTLTTRRSMVEFFLLTFPRFPLRKKEHKSYFGKNRTQDFRTSRCAAYLLDHSGDERNVTTIHSYKLYKTLVNGVREPTRSLQPMIPPKTF